MVWLGNFKGIAPLSSTIQWYEQVLWHSDSYYTSYNLFYFSKRFQVASLFLVFWNARDVPPHVYFSILDAKYLEERALRSGGSVSFSSGKFSCIFLWGIFCLPLFVLLLWFLIFWIDALCPCDQALSVLFSIFLTFGSICWKIILTWLLDSSITMFNFSFHIL